MIRLGAIAAAALLVACSGDPPATSPGGGGAGGDGGEGGGGGSAPAIGGDRPVTVEAPDGLAPGARAPLLIMLHGQAVNGAIEELFLGLSPTAHARGFFYAHPDGTSDLSGDSYWNATDGCCDEDHLGVDDSGYLSGVIDEIEAAYPIDPAKVFILGHSNGGFMAYRMACDHADKIAAVVSLAGAMWEDASHCDPAEAVGVLEVHGTIDDEVLYDGNPAEHYPSVDVTLADWVGLDGCAAAPSATEAGALDVDATVPGDETDVTRWQDGCRGTSDVELWKMDGVGHLPQLTDAARDGFLTWMLAHAKKEP